jgi:lipoate-protein ligase B
LANHGLKPRSYLHALEAVLIEAIRPFNVDAKSIKGFTGLWVGKKKLASIGVAVRSGVTYHGFALNMNNSLVPFKTIHPCRLESDVMTTMAKAAGTPIDENAVTQAVAKTMLHYFGRAQAGPGETYAPS